MAKGKKTGGRDFKPGQSGNPLGSRLHNPAWKAARRMTYDELASLLTFVANATPDELKESIANPETPVLHAAVMKCFAGVIKSGKTQDLERLITLMAGVRPKEVILRNPEGESFRTREPSIEEIKAELAAIEARRVQRVGS
jgi:hypothetical protein